MVAFFILPSSESRKFCTPYKNAVEKIQTPKWSPRCPNENQKNMEILITV
jgi:hypothetical protein